MPQTLLNTTQTDLLEWTTVTANAAPVISSVLDCSNKISARLGIQVGLESTTAPVGTQILVQRSNQATGNEDWYTIDTIITGTVSAVATTTDAVETAGSTLVECGAAVPALNDLVFFKNATIANSEIGRVIARVTTGGSETFTLLDALTNTQAQGTYYNKAEVFDRLYTLEGASRLRCVVNNNYAATAATASVKITCMTCDSVKVVAA